MGPDISAPGMWSFQLGPNNELRWASGTSFSAGVVSGIAALLNAYYAGDKGHAKDATADAPVKDLRNSLLLGANRDIVGPSWQEVNTVGFGAVDAEAALQIFKSGNTVLNFPLKTDRLQATVLGNPKAGEKAVFNSPTVSLNPGEAYDLVFAIAPDTSRVTIQVYDIITPDNFEHAYWPNSLKFQVQSAKRSEFIQPIDEYWDPNLSGDQFTVEIEDGLWKLAGAPKAYQPMEPGLMKVSLVGDFANESAVSFKLRLVREQANPSNSRKPIAHSVLKTGNSFSLPVEIPEGLSQVTFDLIWQRDWRKFPTSDIDLLVVNLNDTPRLLRNDGNGENHWLMLAVKLPGGKSDAIGARITVRTGDLEQVHELVPVVGYLSQVDPRAHFGLGEAQHADVVEIRWPDGQTQRLEDVAANQILTVVQDAK